MSRLIFFTLLSVYLLLIGVTGTYAAFMAIGANAPSPDVLVQIANLDEATQSNLWASLKSAEEKTKKLSEIATNGFQVTLGALIGFLSAIGATMTSQRQKAGGKTTQKPEERSGDGSTKAETVA